ncbi:uncharacterized protein [Argopecten irradians]|uniref:uncharacterized protein n=1 Tax=Argopecten irradians TaxID=31199 RepID=UPI0037237537
MPYKTERRELSSLMVEKVRRCLDSIPLPRSILTDEVVDRLTTLVVVRDYQADQDVVSQGSTSNGIFIIDDGHAEVMTLSGEVIADLSTGDYFGEVSVLYSVPCTATVRSTETCRILLLEEKVNQKLLGNVQVELKMMDWFVGKRYIPVSANMDTGRTVRRMVFNCLKKVQVFREWSDSALRSLVLEINPALIVIYPPGSVVAMTSDPPVIVNVIIRGRAVFCRDDKVTLTEVDIQRDPVVLGEEGILLGLENTIMVRAKTSCQVIPIRVEWIQNIIHDHPSEAGAFWNFWKEKWMAHDKKTSRIHSKYPAYLQFEVVLQLMKQSALFRQCSDRCLYKLCLRGVPREVYPGELVCSKEEYDQHIFVLILKGEAELVTEPALDSEYILGPGQVFCHCDSMESICQVEAVSHCLVVKLTKKDVFGSLESCQDSVLTYPRESEHRLS